MREVELASCAVVKSPWSQAVREEEGSNSEEVTVTRIRANCPACGEVDLLPDDVLLRIVRQAGGELADGSCYRFACPDCEEEVSKPADERIAQLLTTGGVPVEEFDEGAAILEADLPPHPEHPGGGAPLTHDDLLDLHLKLQTDGWFDELLSTTR